MPRLDVWLVEEHDFSSRQAAKRAIKSGHILVNGTTSKPSYQVKRTDIIEVLGVDLDKPKGFGKLQEINEILNGQILSQKGIALDIGSSAGGFLLFLAEAHFKEVIGLEVSKRFSKELFEIAAHYENISIIIDDAFTIDPEIITPYKSLNLLLIDVTTSPEGTQRLMKRFSPLLKSKGTLIAAIKSQLSDELTDTIGQNLAHIGYQKLITIQLDSQRQEFHIVGRHT